MTAIFRSHLPFSQAHILTGALCSAGISAAVGGGNAAHLYGGTPVLDCTILVPEDQIEEAEAFLNAEVGEEPSAPETPAESCPPDGDPPGIGAILYGMLCVAPFAAVVPSFLAGLRILEDTIDSLEPVVQGVMFTYLGTLLFFIGALPLIAVGAGLLLHIIRGYRRGSLLCRVIVVLMTLVCLVASL